MFHLPLEGTKSRELMGDIAHVVEVLAPQNRGKLLSFGQALIQGRRVMATADKAVSRVTYICLGNCNLPDQYGQVVLISIGRRGGWRKEWSFGPL
jgi:hypothetical protein